MARSSKEQTDASRRRIVEAAGRLFREHGFDAVGIADVMKAAGMTQGGFYRHFASKEMLAAETISDSFVGAAAQWRSTRAEQRPTRTLIENYFSDASAEFRCPMLAFGEEIARTPQGSDLRGVYLEGARSLYETFAEAGNERTARPIDDLMFAAMVGAGLLLRVGREEEWIQSIADAVTNEANRRVDEAGGNFG